MPQGKYYESSLAAFRRFFPDIAARIESEMTPLEEIVEDGEIVDVRIGDKRLYGEDGVAGTRAQVETFVKDPRRFLITDLRKAGMGSPIGAKMIERMYREALQSRMRPFADGTRGFPRQVRDIARQLDKRVRFEIEGEDTKVDRDVLEGLDAPLNHLLRNAIDHGIESPAERRAAGKPETALVRVEAHHNAGMLVVTVRDDGRGVDVEAVRTRVLERKLARFEHAMLPLV